ncbi:putative photosystem I Ycf4, assembly [Helianthus debilis subsp. tardiflorus]
MIFVGRNLELSWLKFDIFISVKGNRFFSQGIVMPFYGFASLFISSYLWYTISWNVDIGYDRFDKKYRIVCIFRWGFPRKKSGLSPISYKIYIQFVRIELKEGIYARRVLYMEMRGQGAIPLTRINKNFTSR